MGQLDLERRHRVPAHRRHLVELKARRLLPGPDDVDLDDELALWEERDLLLARLLECKTFKDAAGELQRLAARPSGRLPRRAGLEERFLALAPDLLAGVTAEQLRAAFLRGGHAQARRRRSTCTTWRRCGRQRPATRSRSCSTSCPASDASPSGASRQGSSTASRSSCASSPSSSCSSRAWSTSSRSTNFGELAILWLGGPTTALLEWRLSAPSPTRADGADGDRGAAGDRGDPDGGRGAGRARTAGPAPRGPPAGSRRSAPSWPRPTTPRTAASCWSRSPAATASRAIPTWPPYVERFVLEGQSARLSAAALETLAIVAYKQPVSRAQVVVDPRRQRRRRHAHAAAARLHRRGRPRPGPGPGDPVRHDAGCSSRSSASTPSTTCRRSVTSCPAPRSSRRWSEACARRIPPDEPVIDDMSRRPDASSDHRARRPTPPRASGCRRCWPGRVRQSTACART